MTPPGTAAAHRRAVRRRHAPRAPRRKSGPTHPTRAALAGAAAARPPLALRLGATAMRIGDARLLDRIVRGRAWIALLAIGLMGIVFMQVSLLKLNAGIGRAVTAADTLERQDASLRADISNLGSGERIQDAAAKLGMTTPAAGDVHYLDARGADGARAAASIKPPDPVMPAMQSAAAATGAAPTAQSGAAPAAQQQAPAAQQQAPAAAQQPASATQQQAPAAQQPGAAQSGTAPAAQQPATAQQQSPAAATPTAPPATSGASTAVAGGASAPQGQG